MSTVTVIWSGISGACLMLAILHFLVWWRDRRAWTSLIFVIMTVGAVAHAIVELKMMQARTPEAFVGAVRWLHPFSFICILTTILFIRLYLGTGRTWLAGLTVGLRLASLIVNFSFAEGINYLSLTSLKFVSFLGNEVAVPGEGVVNPWLKLAQVVFPLWFIFVVDAAVLCWRKGEPEGRRRALVVGGGMAIFILFGTGQVVLIFNGFLKMPVTSSVFFLCTVFAIGYELSRDVWRAAGLARDLQASERRLSLAATAARVALWEWRVEKDEIWATTVAREFFAIAPDEPLRFRHFTQTLHPDDRATVLRVIEQALERGGEFAAEYRRLLPDGSVRWIAGSGRVEREPRTGATLMRGVSLDITERRRVEGELDRQREELEHLSRVATLGELSGSLAHELNQPLAIILANAQAAQRMLAKTPPDLTELREILEDIVSQDRRAGDVIKRLRALLKRGQVERQRLALNEVVEEVLGLMRSDLITRGVSVHLELGRALPPVAGDRVPLQQVILNLVTNAADAMAANVSGARPLFIASHHAGTMVRVSIRDAGCGLPPDPAKIFEPFFTTKTHGLGLGLPICRTIVMAHGGKLWVEPNEDRGATFHLELPQEKRGEKAA